jgi:subtilase family serine protease
VHAQQNFVFIDNKNFYTEINFFMNVPVEADGTLGIVHPDLSVRAVRAPATANSAATVQLEWEVGNVGSSAVSGTWTDRIYLSRDGSVGAGDLLVATREATRSLAVGASYTETASFVLPVEASGDYQLIVVSDALGQVAELNAENNNQGSTALQVDLAPYADLVVTAIVAPEM